MNEYLVERYLPGVVAVRYIGSTFIQYEESCFCRFEGAPGKEDQ